MLAVLTTIVQPAFAAPLLIGSWFGIGQPDDKGSMWLIHQAADGSFTAQFRACVRGRNQDEIETGRWSLKGDVETLHIQTVDGAPVSQDDMYKILAQDGKKQAYRYLATGFSYSSRRVDANFALPDCQLVN
jgi:hypothetical protein